MCFVRCEWGLATGFAVSEVMISVLVDFLAWPDPLLLHGSLMCWQAHLDAAPASVSGHGRVMSVGRRVFVYLCES